MLGFAEFGRRLVLANDIYRHIGLRRLVLARCGASR